MKYSRMLVKMLAILLTMISVMAGIPAAQAQGDYYGSRNIKFDHIRESVLVDIFSGKSYLPPGVVEELRKELPADEVARYEKATEEGLGDAKPLNLEENPIYFNP